MSQHFLLSAAARTLSLAKVMRMSDDQAFDAFRSIRWAETDGDAVCGKCGCFECYTYKARRIFKCRACGAQFSVTSGTIFICRPTRWKWRGGKTTVGSATVSNFCWRHHRRSRIR